MGDNVHVRLPWKKSRFSGAGNCVEVARDDRLIYVRDSKIGPTGSVLAFTEAEWDAFVSGVRAGEFGIDSLRPRAVEVSQGL